MHLLTKANLLSFHAANRDSKACGEPFFAPKSASSILTSTTERNRSLNHKNANCLLALNPHKKFTTVLRDLVFECSGGTTSVSSEAISAKEGFLGRHGGRPSSNTCPHKMVGTALRAVRGGCQACRFARNGSRKVSQASKPACLPAIPVPFSETVSDDTEVGKYRRLPSLLGGTKSRPRPRPRPNTSRLGSLRYFFGRHGGRPSKDMTGCGFGGRPSRDANGCGLFVFAHALGKHALGMGMGRKGRKGREVSHGTC